MNHVVDAAMDTDEARNAFADGWSLREIRDGICVSCGDIRLPFTRAGSGVCKDGRKIGYRPNGSQYDAGRLCENCMINKEG